MYVFEEAHSLIPEWNAVASAGDKEATNGTAKAILQGRKYGLGCLVITQRTANVTKTILNQCNTVFGLRARSQIETESPALFLNSSRKRLSTQGIANVVAHLRRKAGVERHVTPHMLRHTVATLLLQNGVDIRVVQEFLGHASIATTQRYTHISKEHLIAVLQKCHPSLNLRLEHEAASISQSEQNQQ